MNIFLDIGAHVGESIEQAINSKYNFEKIIAIEPANYCISFLKKYKDSRIEIQNIALGSSNRFEFLYGAGSVGASIFAEKKAYWSTKEKIEFRKFSEWWEVNIKNSDRIWLKINTEGGELEIINELVVINPKNIVGLLVSFDIEKIDSLKNHKADLIAILEKLEIKFFDRNFSKINVSKWLDVYPQLRSASTFRNRVKSWIRPELPISRNLRRVLRPIFPRKIWVAVALRIGPNRKR